MTVSITSQGINKRLHLCNGEARALLENLGYDGSGSLDRRLPAAELAKKIGAIDPTALVTKARDIDWSSDSDIGDMGENLRRLAAIVNGSASGSILLK